MFANVQQCRAQSRRGIGVSAAYTVQSVHAPSLARSIYIYSVALNYRSAALGRREVFADRCSRRGRRLQSLQYRQFQFTNTHIAIDLDELSSAQKRNKHVHAELGTLGLTRSNTARGHSSWRWPI